ncbi:hypothetical protein Poli38472_011167 [Pythium oligandrum]|uniref:Uncharacterized protein n=1 Tax=Pythium oligandrum TaxID=41045 RepID=A0A8K1FQ40_PYTOL|nr:hypothetical protein Poli38472_011167 [Pythium oligandrum]|eukprot:TMW67547.1 hypothetical protein Poli38472_011167 [Pythium oligandrum]
MNETEEIAARFEALDGHVDLDYATLDESPTFTVSVPTMGTPEELRDLRDALLTTGAIGPGYTRRDEWLKALQVLARIHGVMHIEAQRAVQPRYTVVLSDMSHGSLDWTSSMRHFFGYDEHTDDFDEDWEDVKALIQEFEREVDKFQSIPIDLLVYAPSSWSLSDQAEYVKSITTIVRETMRQTQRAERAHPFRPRFELKTVELYFQALHVTPGVAEQQKLLALNVAVKSIALPTQTSIESEEIPDWRSA